MNNILELSNEEKLQLARHPNTSQETLNVLATDENSSVRCAVARHPNTSDEILFFLLEDRDFYVAYSVRENPNVKELMRRLILMRMNEFL